MFNNPEEYLHAWLIYLLGATMMFGCWWYASRLFGRREVRQLSRVVIFVGLFMPWFSDSSYEYLAPAAIISVVEALTDGAQAFWRAGAPLLAAIAVFVALSLCWNIWCWRRAKIEASLDT